jgi:signal transduction histidine kinase
VTLASNIQKELRRSVDVIAKGTDSLVACVKQGKLPDTYTNDLQQIKKAIETLRAFVERTTSPPPNEESAAAESFASALRHDMRTPINAIRGYSEIIAEETRNVAEPQGFLTSIIDATDDILANITKITSTAWKE